MNSLGHEVVSFLSDKFLSKERHLQRFGKLLAQNLDIPVIARFASGRYWNKSSVEQRKSYLSAFTVFAVRTYAVRLAASTSIASSSSAPIRWARMTCWCAARFRLSTRSR